MSGMNKGCGCMVGAWWALAGILLVLGLGRVGAEEPLPAVTADHVMTVFGVEEGLMSPALAAVTYCEADGRVWVGSFGGPWTYDGREFQDLTGWMDPSPGRRVLRSVMTDGDGRVWMGSFGSIVVHDGKQRRAHGREAGVPAHLIWDLADIGGGEVWAATTQGLIRGKDGRFEEVAGPDVLGKGETYRVLGAGGRAWCQSRDGLSRWEGNGWTIMAQAEPAGAGGLMGMARSAGGGLWVAFEGEVRLLRDGRWAKSWTRPAGMRGDVVRLLEDARGNVWMEGWQHGLAVFAPDGRVRSLGREQGLPNDSVSGLAEDGEGNVWVATNGGGLVRLRPLAFRTHGLESGIRQVVNHMVEVAPGRLLLATQGDGIMEWRDGRATPDPDRNERGDPMHPWVSVLHRDRQGVLWAGLTGVGLGRRDNKGWSVVPGEQVGAQQVMSLQEDAAGRLWVGTVAGVAMGEQGTFRPMGADSMAPHAVIVSMAEDGEGSLWWLFGRICGRAGASRDRRARRTPASQTRLSSAVLCASPPSIRQRRRK